MTGGFEALHFKNVLKKLSVLIALEEIESMFVGFLSTSECFRENQNAVETLACSPCSSAFFILPNFHSCFYNTVHVFFFWKIIWRGMTCFCLDYKLKTRQEEQSPRHSSFSGGIICGLHRQSFAVGGHFRSGNFSKR